MALSLTGGSGLETLLPAAVISAVTSVAAGLTNSSTQVYVSRSRRTGPAVTSPEAWVRPIDPEELEGGLGHLRRAYRYEIEIQKASGTMAELEAWAQALIAYFDGYARPAATGLWAAFVEAVVIDMHPQEGGTVAVRARLRFEEA